MRPTEPLFELLRRHRAAAGLTQEELAEKAGVSARGISDLERGVERKPYKVTVTRLADALGLAGDDRDAFILAARGLGRQSAAAEVPAPGAPNEPGKPARGIPRRLLTSRWALAGLIVMIAVAAAFLIARVVGGSSGSQPYNQTPDGLRDQRLVRVVLGESDLAFRRSVGCACDRGLEAVKTGPDLQKYRQQIRDLRSHGERMVVTPHLFQVDSINLPSRTIASARVTKDETSGIYRRGRLVEVCAGPYSVRYHLVRVSQAWKVDDTLILNGGQSCHTV